MASSDSPSPMGEPAFSGTPLESGTRRRPPSTEGFALKGSDERGLVISGRYEVEGLLGEGGTALVYLALDAQTDSRVVIKRMKEEVAKCDKLRACFLLEARALSQVDHPAVIRVLDIEEPVDEPPYLALEALKGETLGDYVKREGMIPLALAARLFREAAEALQAVHDAGVVHRDIKPDNLYLVEQVGRPLRIKVLDFGMAHLEAEGHDEASTSILGTAQYMAPEQILVEPVDARTDVYALGVVLFRALTGHLPFDGQNKPDLLRHQLFSPVPPVHWLNEELPEAIQQIVSKATRKAPGERFQTMSEFAQALSELIDSDFESARITFVPPSTEPDIYEPRSARGKHAASVLAMEFGIYSRPHHPALAPVSDSKPD
jgi:serine/threonine protein kinase